jgi:hypothetical protein
MAVRTISKIGVAILGVMRRLVAPMFRGEGDGLTRVE